MQVLKEGQTVFVGSLDECWAYLKPFMKTGKKLANEVEIASDEPNALPAEYTVHAKEGEY
jgi:hypothetical protein